MKTYEGAIQDALDRIDALIADIPETRQESIRSAVVDINFAAYLQGYRKAQATPVPAETGNTFSDGWCAAMASIEKVMARALSAITG